MQSDAKAIVEAVLTAARTGDMTAARIVLRPRMPARKDRPVMFSLPEINSAADASSAMAGMLAAVAAGEITPGEAQDVAGLIDAFRKTIETAELEARIATLERREKPK